MQANESKIIHEEEFSSQQLYSRAQAEKIFAAEKSISFLRFYTILFNTLAFVFISDKSGYETWLGYLLIVVAFLYSLFVLIVQPYKKYPVFLASYFTCGIDAVLISLWLHATGGFESPFFALWYLSIIAVAFRFSLFTTFIASIVYSVCYIAVLQVSGELYGHITDVSVKLGYIFLVGSLGSLISKETFTQTQEKILMKKLAEDAKKAEKTLKSQAELYESLLKAQSEMGEGIAITEDERFIYVNEALCKIYGYSEDELFEMPSYYSLIAPDERQITARRFNERMSGKNELSEYNETTIINKAGERVDIGYTTKRFEMGNRVKLFSIIRDVTRRKQIEENLYKLAAIVESSDDAIIYRALDLNIVNWNKGAEKLYGYTEDEVVGKPSSILVPGDRVKEERDLIERLIRGEHINHYETVHLTKDYRKIFVSLSLSIIKDPDGAVKGFSSIARDISERKSSDMKLLQKTKELARSNAELEMFAFAASHDLQEPLRKIRLFGDMLEAKYQSSLDDIARSYINRMQTASSRMQTLIDDVLTLSRLGKNSEPFIETNINAAIDEVLNDLEVTISHKKAVITMDKLPYIKAVPLQMRQLFLNLISNSLKYGQKDIIPHVTITSEVVRGENIPEAEEMFKTRKYCRIFVKDNGIGFDEKYSKRIFMMFQRLHGKSDYQGSGMGLAICKKIIDNHQGYVTVRSKIGEGSTFVISLPV